MTRDEFFDKLRKAVPGIWKRPGAIQQGNELFDAMQARVVPDTPSVAELPGQPGEIAAAGVALIKRFEGCHKKLPNGMIMAYPDPGTGNLPITIGWGTTVGMDGKPIPRSAIISQAEADALLTRDLQHFSRKVTDAIGAVPTSQDQFDAMTSFAYNVGHGALRNSTLLRKHKAGDYKGAAREFDRWNRAGGRVLPGLVKRRAAERQLYERGS